MIKWKINSIAGLLLLGACSIRPEAENVNLLFLWTDQQRFDTMRAYGNELIKTPQLNKLADESIVFKRAYVTQPVCTPARSSVMTGLFPHTNGCVENNIRLKGSTKTLPELINDPAYKTAYMGKWHLGDEVFAQHGFDEWYAIEDGYHMHYSKQGDSDVKSTYHHWLVEKGISPDANGRFSRGLASRLPVELGKPSFLAEKAIDFLERNASNPFILYVNFLEPHSPFNSTFNEYHHEDSLYLTNDNSTFEDLSYRNQMRRLSKDFVGSDEIPDFIRRYWGLVSKVDMSVGDILQRLRSLGSYDNTMIVFTSDHGEMLGSHALQSKRFAYDESSRVPLLIKPPDMANQRIVEEPVSHIDIVPTILDVLGYPLYDELQGKSLKHVILGDELSDNYVFFEMAPLAGIVKSRKIDQNIFSQLQLPISEAQKVIQANYRAVVSPDGWKMVVSNNDKNQLFNLKADPVENVNLYNSPGVEAVLARLKEKMLAWQKETKDEIELRF